MRTVRQPPRGLTLLESLVVVAVIVTVLAFVLPALQAARETARRTICLSNVRQIALAIGGHEAKKGYVPGWRNRLVCSGTTIYPTWPTLVLPQLDRADLYAAIVSSTANSALVTAGGTIASPVWTTGSATFVTAVAAGGSSVQTQVFLSVFDCPSNPVADRSSATPLDRWATTTGVNVSMAYAGNGGTGSNQYRGDGVMADTAITATTGTTAATTSGRITVAQIAAADGLGGTLLLGEKVGPGDPVRTPWPAALLVSDTTGVQVWNGASFTTGTATGGACIFGLGGSYSGTGAVVSPAVATNWQLSALHPGLVVVAFCDGRTNVIDTDIDGVTFGQLVTSGSGVGALSATARSAAWSGGSGRTAIQAN